ncbi:hypothetical protein BDV37DRAFT_280949 [Aspergillus pseudonomiae]|uniref:Uncharacterized protein n=1 Tax=Aspergillus pseudonomiae TaxID=1506151 RepID=A0A5N7DJB5_9EURO|nr:uncharacterized protein BDV37DRAFT_280949 [Aspergillus pseudonomiae]KAE8406355.1 hypothetical protein BDV37DRAFT_280949 [Aspergillus pseudonomiae]
MYILYVTTIIVSAIATLVASIDHKVDVYNQTSQNHNSSGNITLQSSTETSKTNDSDRKIIVIQMVGRVFIFRLVARRFASGHGQEDIQFLSGSVLRIKMIRAGVGHSRFILGV